DLLLLLLGTSRDALHRQRNQRVSWANEVKSREGFLKTLVESEDDQNRGFYPPLPVPQTAATIALVDNTETAPAEATGASTPPSAPAEGSEKRQSRVLLRDSSSTSKLFGSVFSKRSSMISDNTAASGTSASNVASTAAAELQDRAKMVQQQLNTML